MYFQYLYAWIQKPKKDGLQRKNVVAGKNLPYVNIKKIKEQIQMKDERVFCISNYKWKTMLTNVVKKIKVISTIV